MRLSGALLTLCLMFMMSGSVLLAEEEADLNQLATGNNTFAFELYRTILQGEDVANVIFSPYSISQALAMTYAGAEGQTAEEMAATLHYLLPQAQLHPAFRAVSDSLNSRADSQPEDDDAGQVMKFNVANALWGLEGFPFRESYLDLIEANYGAGLQFADFINDAEAARQEINAWVEDQTEDRIRDIVPEGVLTPDTRLVLANAIYFNATWRSTFEEYATRDDDFNLLDGSQTTVRMMNQQDRFRHFSGDGFQALELPYYGGDVSMIVLLPDEGAFESFEQTLSADLFAQVVDGLAFQDVMVAMPQFEFDFDLSLSDILAQMGMPSAFEPEAAQFDGIAHLDQIGENMFISDVLHKAFVKVDEDGTEAAAATVVVMGITSAIIAEYIEFRMDRPFIFAIYDHETDSILFVGRVVDPAG